MPENSTLPEPTAQLFIDASEKACGKPMSTWSRHWWKAWTDGRFENFKKHWEAHGRSLLDKFEENGVVLAEFAIGTHCSPADLKRWEDHLTAQGWRPDGSFRPTPFCIAKLPK